MENKLIAKASVHINVPAAKVWEGLTNPELIKEYFFGTEAISDWKVGSPLHFKGEWEGKPYLDKGTILQSEFPGLFQYNYFSSFSGQDDKPENYAVITYALSGQDGGTLLSVTQDNIDTVERKEHSEKNWAYLLGSLKELLEKKD